MSFMSAQPTIAMITDYGDKDGFPGILKGILYKTVQAAMQTLPTQQIMPPVVDITHQIKPFNIAGGAWVLNRCYAEFPENTIFVCVVDPGVGKESQNKLLLCWPERKLFFIGPDNGIFTPILKNNEKNLRAFSLTNASLFRQAPKPPLLPEGESAEIAHQSEVSRTFHGRDIYAPLAGHLAHAIMTFMSEEFLLTVGDRLDTTTLIQLDMPTPSQENKAVTGHIVYSDNFGNLTTDIPSDWLKQLTSGGDDKMVSIEMRSAKGQFQWVSRHVNSYSEGQGLKEVFVVPASTGTLELALFCQNARESLDACEGDAVTIRLG